MKLTILGRCGAYPLPGEATSGYLLQSGGKNILIDCGSGVLSNLQRFVPIPSLDMLILSHLHHDHQADLPILKYAIGMLRRFGTAVPDLPVYLPAGPVPLVPAAEGTLDLHFYSSDTEMEADGIRIRFVPGSHPAESYGMRFTSDGRTVAYTGDTRMCPTVSDMLRGADLAVMDAGSLERLRAEPMVHMTARECAGAAREGGVGRTLLSHIVPPIPAEETLREAREVYDRVEIARPLETYDI